MRTTKTDLSIDSLPEALGIPAVKWSQRERKMLAPVIKRIRAVRVVQKENYTMVEIEPINKKHGTAVGFAKRRPTDPNTPATGFKVAWWRTIREWLGKDWNGHSWTAPMKDRSRGK